MTKLAGERIGKDAVVGTGERGEEADDEGAGDIHDDRAPGKGLADQACGDTRAPVAGRRPLGHFPLRSTHRLTSIVPCSWST